MTEFDKEVIEEWRVGFAKKRDVFGVPPDVWDRVQYLRDRGYRRFPHVQAVLGRRASKGLMGGVLGAEQIAYFYSLDDWQGHYGIDPGQDGYLNVFATSQSQAQRFQFADIRRTVENCKYLQGAISTSKEYYFSIRTPADVRKIAELRSAGVVVEREIATLKAIALSANSSSGRGAVSFANYFDEFAFLIQGTGSNKSDAEIYESAQPSLDQFGKDALTYIPSSPFCLAPETRVLTEDLRWVPVGSLLLGDKLIGFDENIPGGKGKGRCWRQAEITETSVIYAPRYKITMESGKEIVSTSEHMWLARRSQFSYEWFKTSTLKPGDKIKSIGVEPWGVDTSREAGYLAGFFDGEGYLAGTVNRFATLGYSQNVGLVSDYVSDLLIKKGFVPKDYTPGEKLAKVRIQGGMPEIMRFLGQIRPERLLPKFAEKFYGSRIYGAASPAVDRVASVEYLDDGEVIALGTSTSTLVAEGLLSHNTKSGKCYELYRQGSIPMSSYADREGIAQEKADIEADAEEITADPEMLVFQGASWELYRDWEHAPELVGVRFKRPVQPDLTSEIQQRRKRRNPEKFKVEREGQWAEVESAYLDPDKVDEAFVHPEWREPLEPQDFGRVDRQYRIHCDPGRVNANFALAVAHLEDMPPDESGDVWPCAIFDYLKVWKPSDYLDHTIDYIEVEKEIKDVLRRFPSTAKISFDQWNSASFLANIRKEFSPNIRVVEEIATERVNQARCEKFKSALNLGWLKTYLDHYGEEGNCLLEQELKFLTEKNGKVMKQDFGPCTTKDLFDAVSIVTTDLLHDALDRWAMKLATGSSYGTTDVAGMRSGRELERIGSFRGGAVNRRGSLAREMLTNHHTERARSKAQMDREAGFPTRGRVRDSSPKPFMPSRKRF